MDKQTELLTLRIPPALKTDYDRLDPVAKKRAKLAALNALSRICFAEIHYDPSVHFGPDYIVDDED